MTVASTATPRKTYDGNDLTVNFPITFPYNEDETLIVVVHVDASDVETPWTLNGGGDTGYTVASDEVVANTAPATGARLVIYRETPLTQLIDLITNQAYSANVLEAGLDLLTLMVQEVNDGGTVLGVTLPVTVDDAVSGQLPLPEANTFLSWNATATEIINAAAQVGGATVTAFMATVLDDANAAAARATLEALGAASIVDTDAGISIIDGITPAAFVGSKRNIRWLAFNLIEAGTDCAVTTNIGGDFISPIAGTILQSDTSPFYFYGSNSTAGVTGSMVIDANINGTSICTTNKLDFDSAQKTTTTAGTKPDLTTTALAIGDIITFDVDSLHTTPAKGLTVYMAVREG